MPKLISFRGLIVTVLLAVLVIWESPRSQWVRIFSAELQMSAPLRIIAPPKA